MNFYFGQLTTHTEPNLQTQQTQWFNRTIFPDLNGEISTHYEDGFALTLVHDPKQIGTDQSNAIYIDDDFICASDCTLYNKEQLAKSLNIDIEQPVEKFFIEARKSWGKDFANNFDGIFSFVIYDRNKHSLFSAIDALGYAGFNYHPQKNKLFFASDIGTLLDNPNVDKSVNFKRFYQLLRYSNNPPEQTFFDKCYYCPPSHYLEYKNREIQTNDYWKLTQLAKPKSELSFDEAAKKFYQILDQALLKQTPANEQAGLMLSGGFDSSLLAGVISKNPTLRSQITCYSYTFNEFKNCDESIYIDKTLQQLDLPGKQINGDYKTDISNPEDRLTSVDVVNMDVYSFLPKLIYEAAKSEGKNIIINGQYGDDMFAGLQYMYADLIKQKKLLLILKSIFATQNTGKQLSKFLNSGIRPLLPNPLKNLYRKFCKPINQSSPFEITDDMINDQNLNLHSDKSLSFQQKKLLILLYFRNTPESIGFTRKWLYLRFSMKCVQPYYCKEMIEFMWHIPVQYLELCGKKRGLQIQALKLFELNHIVTRDKKTKFTDLLQTELNQEYEDIQELVNNSELLKDKIFTRKGIDLFACTKERNNFNRFYLLAFVLVEWWWRKLKKKSNRSYNWDYM